MRWKGVTVIVAVMKGTFQFAGFGMKGSNWQEIDSLCQMKNLGASFCPVLFPFHGY